MSDLNAPGVFGGRQASMRKTWKPSALASALFVAWLALLAVPIVALYGLDGPAATSPEIQPPPWMPLYPSII